MRLTRAEYTALYRMFVLTNTTGRRFVHREITTNSTKNTLAIMHALTRKGAITYEEDERMGAVFGCKVWPTKLTDAGHVHLSACIQDPKGGFP